MRRGSGDRELAARDERRRPRERLLARLGRTAGRFLRRRLTLPREGGPAPTREMLILLGLPTFGLALAISMLTTFGPVLLIRLTDSTSQVGALIGGEGAFALVIPLLSGALSDRMSGSPAARRLPFVLAGAPLVGSGLLVLALSGSYGLAAGAVVAFFVGYYLYYPPYRALYADLLPRSLYARAQASQAVMRGVGLGVALLAGGLLLSAWRPLPFVIAAAAVVAATLVLPPLVRLDPPQATQQLAKQPSVRTLLRSRELRIFAAANTLWEFSFSGLKSFIVLYVVRGLGESPSTASAVIAVVAVAYIVGAPLAGRLAERHGIVRVLEVASLVYGGGLLFGTLPQSLGPLLIGLPFVALAGAVVMTLPQALAFSIAPAGSGGAAAGLLDFSRGLGVVLGPVAVGAAIEATGGLFSPTHGYSAMWPVIGIPVLLSLLPLRRLESRGGELPEPEGA